MTVTEAEMLEYAQEAYEMRRRKPGKRKMKPEDALQIQCIKELRHWLNYGTERLRYIVAQPEKSRTYRMQQIDRAKGLLGNPGHPELLLFPADRMPVLIEFKAKDGKESEDQFGWREWCHRVGYRHEVVRSREQFAIILAAF